MSDIGERQTAAPDNPVSRRARPSGFDEKLSHARAKSQERSDHRRAPGGKTVGRLLCKLNTSARAVDLSRQSCEGIQQPSDSGLACQIVRGTQAQVFGYVSASGCARAPFSLRQRQRPCFIKLAQSYTRYEMSDVRG